MGQLIEFETAKEAKEAGFNEPTLELYKENGEPSQNIEKITNKQLLSNYYSAPTQEELQKWLREVKKINVFNVIEPHSKENQWRTTIYNMKKESYVELKNYNSYEIVLEKGLYQAITSVIYNKL